MRKWLPTNLLLAALLSVQLPAVWRSAETSRKHLPDLFQDWGTARQHAEGLPIYGDQAGAARRQLGVEWDDRSPLFRQGSTRPPAAAWLALPLGRLDFPTAFRRWNQLSIAALAATLLLLAWALPPRARWWTLVPAVAALATWDAVGWGLREGQWSLFLGALITGAWFCARRGADAWAGGLLGIAAAIKFFPAILLLRFARKGRLRGLAAGLATLLALNAAALATFGHAAFFTYAERVAPQLAPWRGSALNVSLPAIPHRLFAPLDRQDDLLVQPWAKFPAAAEGLGLLAMAVVLGIWLRQAPRLDDDAAFSAGVLAMLLAAPLTWGHYLCAAALPLWHWLRANPPWPARVLVCVALWVPPILLLRPWLPGPGEPPLQLGPWASAPVLALPTSGLLWLFAATRRRRRG